jgi:hypothetical protein
MAPYFYALSRNFGNPEEDLMIDFYDGLITKETKTIFEIILESGPMDTVSLRRAAYMTGKETDYPFEKALAYLQSDFKILPVGISDSGAWHYAFIYDLVHRHFPDIPLEAEKISRSTSQKKILENYFTSVGTAQYKDLIKLFGWTKDETWRAVDDLVLKGKIIKGIKNRQYPGEWLAIKEILE